MNSEHDDELDRAQTEVKAALIRAKRIVIESRALLLNQRTAAAQDEPRINVPPPTAE